MVRSWEKQDLVDTDVLSDIPHQEVGRALQVGEEEITWLVAALKEFTAGDDEKGDLVDRQPSATWRSTIHLSIPFTPVD